MGVVFMHVLSSFLPLSHPNHSLFGGSRKGVGLLPGYGVDAPWPSVYDRHLAEETKRFIAFTHPAARRMLT